MGELGDGTTMSRDTPPTSDVLTGVQAIAASVFNTCALMTSGGVRCWGDNSNGQLGDGAPYQSTPTPVSGICQ
jgi:alpha-tubulin suppressor-like RCC1 family protein